MKLQVVHKVAVIGAGYMSKEHIKVFASMSDVEVSGIYSRTRHKAEVVARQFNIPVVADSISELYEKTNADILIVAVSELSVKDVVEQAFQYSWLCLIEKPAGYNYENALQVNELSEKYKARVCLSLNRRYYSSTRAVLSALNEVEGQRLIQVYDQEAPLLLDRPSEIHNNWMYANSIHVVDYLKMFGRGEVTDVIPMVHWDPNEPRYVVAKVQFSSGDIGIYTAIWNGPGPWATTITTQDKRWELRPLESAFVQTYPSRKLASLPSHHWDDEFKPGLRLQAEDVINLLKGTPHSLTTLQDGLEIMRLVKEIYEI